MKMYERVENSSEAVMPQESFSNSSANDMPDNTTEGTSPRLGTDVANALELGEQVIGFAGGILNLGRVEASLAIRTLPKLLMLWLAMMPVIVLTWCSFSALVSWMVTAATGEIGFGMLTFFLLQVLLLIVCRWLFLKYRARMTFPYTRHQLAEFFRSVKDEVDQQSKTS